MQGPGGDSSVTLWGIGRDSEGGLYVQFMRPEAPLTVTTDFGIYSTICRL